LIDELDDEEGGDVGEEVLPFGSVPDGRVEDLIREKVPLGMTALLRSLVRETGG